MMRIALIFMLFAFYVKIVTAQNLVLNPSFESYIVCPNSIGKFYLVNDWKNPIQAGFYNASPDYFHICASGNSAGIPSNAWGYQYAQEGSAYAGGYSFLKAYPDFREYIEGTLDSALQQGEEYEVSFWVSLGDTCNIYTPEIGLYFSDTLVQPMNPSSYILPFTPHLLNTTVSLNNTSTWQKLTWNYTASGGERYFIIGNFDYPTTYYTMDTSRMDVAYYYIDNVYIGPQFTGIFSNGKTANIQLYPNPTTASITLEWHLDSGEKGQLFLFNALGQMIRQESIQGKEGQKQIALNRFAPGIYFCKLYFEGKEIYQEKIILIE